MKILNGHDLADYMKENQAHTVQNLKAHKVQPRLVIIRDNDNPVITKYVHLKRKYGEDIGVEVEDWLREDVAEAIHEANTNPSVHGVIVQLPLKDKALIDKVVKEIVPEKDVDGLANNIHEANNVPKEYSSGDINNQTRFESATATAINWLLAGYDIDLKGKKIAIVGRGRLVGAPLERMWKNSGYDVVSATGVPHLIKDEMVQSGAVVVDAGTASEGGVLVGDIDDTVRERTDLKAITPKIGGVGPLTVTALFEHVLIAASRQ